MTIIQGFVALCFALPVLFLFGVGCKASEQALKIAGNEIGTDGNRAISYALCGLGSFMLSGLLAVVATLLYRAVAA